jgi:sigma-B regulation protein RsbU (phosphoserine phosphatase)
MTTMVEDAMAVESATEARVLVADDQPDVLEALSLLLRQEGYQVCLVNSPAAILAALREQSFDLLLMDLNYARDTTSGREGLDLLARIEAESDLPIVAMTGWGSVELAVEAMQHGVADFVQKPWDNDRLIESVQRYIAQGRRAARQSQAENERRAQQAFGELRRREEESEEACHVQELLVPSEIEQLPGYRIAAAWRPARGVGGDYFDVLRLGADSLGLCIGDVTGKGVPAALLMANLQATVHALAGPQVEPTELCARVNSAIRPHVGDHRFITFFYGLLDGPARRFVYTNAGHNPPVLVRRDGSCQRLQNGGPLLGLLPAWQGELGVVELAPGDRLVLFTDGVTEATDASGEEFQEERLVDLVITYRHLPPAVLKARIMEELRDFTRDQWNDDATLLVLGCE